MNFIEIEGLKKYFGNVKAVDGLSFAVRPGEIYGLLGPNGAGKTTTLKCIMGLLDRDAGNVSVMGHDPSRNPLKVKESVGYVAEEPIIYESLTPNEYFEFIASIRRIDRDHFVERLNELVDSFGIREYMWKPIIALSKGTRQKIHIIGALLHTPPVLIMDEPLSGLDARSDRIVKDILKIHTERGGAVLLSTHIMDIAEDLCDRIGIINKGRMVAEGTLNELRRKVESISTDLSLEDIFLKITEQDEEIKVIIEKLRRSL